MGVYLSFLVARRVPDPTRDKPFVANALSRGGIHSSSVRTLLRGVAKHAPELASPAWYKNAFYMDPPVPLAHKHFFDPSEVMGDLVRMQSILSAHAASFPTMYWLRLENRDGIRSLDALTSSSLSIYHEGQPSMIFGGWDKVELRPGYPADASQPKVDLTSQTSFACRLHSKNPLELDGLEVTVSFDRQNFASFIATDLEAARAVCRWAHLHACLVVPFWS